MATVITKISRSIIVSNLDTYNFTVTQAGMYTVAAAVSLIPTSASIIVLKLNGSTVVSTPSPAANQIIETLQTTMNCAVNDVIGITISSGLAADTAPNDFKGIITIRQGSF